MLPGLLRLLIWYAICLPTSASIEGNGWQGYDVRLYTSIDSQDLVSKLGQVMSWVWGSTYASQCRVLGLRARQTPAPCGSLLLMLCVLSLAFTLQKASKHGTHNARLGTHRMAGKFTRVTCNMLINA